MTIDAPEAPETRKRTPVGLDAGTGAPFDGELETLIGARLRAHAGARIRSAWRSLRADEIGPEEFAEAMLRWEETVLGSPTTIGIELAARRNKSEAALADAARGGGFTLLEKLEEGGVGPLPEIVRDLARFQILFQRGPVGRSISGVTIGDRPDDEIGDGATVVYPPGVFLLRGFMSAKDPFPSDVTIAGAGMNATLFVLDAALSTRGSLRNFSMRDCTVHTDGNYLFDLRTSPASMVFDRVRFTGFDSGAGCSCLIATRENLLWARDCRFEGGHGRAPWSGGLLDVRTDALLARFERCTLSRLSLNLHWVRDGASLAFLACALDELLDTPFSANARPGVVFDDCAITYYAGDRQQVPARDLNELFPQWRERLGH